MADHRTVAHHAVEALGDLVEASTASQRTIYAPRLDALRKALVEADAESKQPPIGAAGYFKNLRETQPYLLAWEGTGAEETIVGFTALAEKLALPEKAVKRKFDLGRGVFKLYRSNPNGPDPFGTDTLTVTRLKR